MQKTFLQPRRTLALALVMALFLTLFALPSFAAGLNGNGTADDPYQIYTEADLFAFGSKVNGGQLDAHAIMENDISLTAPWVPVGTKDAPFTGTFDGGGHTISNFYTDYYLAVVGMFLYNNGTIQNLTVDTGQYNYVMATDSVAIICAVNRGTIRNCTSQGSAYGYGNTSFVGGIAALNFGTISDCTNTAFIGGGCADACAGGIVGVAAAGAITNCTNKGSVSLMDTGSPSSELCVGGIVGFNYQSSIERCTNQASVGSDSTLGYVGGVAGLNNGLISNSLNSAQVSKQGLSGGVAGYIFTNPNTGMTAEVRSTLDTVGNMVYGKNEGGAVSNNFYKSTTTDGGTSAGQIAVTDAQLKSGEIAYRLNGNSTSDVIWGQNLSSDTAPVIGNTNVVYAQYQDGKVQQYTNDQTHTHTFDENGKCTVQGCGYESVRLDGWTLTLDGALGVTFYYQIDPMYLTQDYDVSATFTLDGAQTTVPLDKNYSYHTSDKTVYGFRFYVDSDKATHEIAPVLTVRKGDAVSVTLAQDQTYRIYDYLKTIIDNKSGQYSQELVTLAKTLATYDYYANEYFGYSSHYEPQISLLPLNDVTSEKLEQYKQVSGAFDEDTDLVKHYASNLYLRESVFPRYLAKLAAPDDASVDTNNLYMGYRVQGSGDLYTYVKAEPSGQSYAGNAAKRPASELDTTYEIAFFVKEGASYRQISPVKQASVYSYIYTVLTSSAASNKLRDVSKALYLYGEAAKSYFATVQ